MITLGINSGFTKSGRHLNDGGACIVVDGKIVSAIQEERITREKYAGGFKESIKYVCEGACISVDQIDLIVVSSCIDKLWTVDEAINILNLKEYGFDKKKVVVLDHHLSHAFGGFISSGYSEALVCVLDNMGNKLTNEEEIWEGGFERSSYYKAYWENGRPCMDLLDRDAKDADKIGYGEAFRYFTHYFGWDSYKHAGKTMGLSAYGNPNAFKDIRLFETISYEEVCLLGSIHDKPEEELLKYFKKYNIELPKRLEKNQEVTQYYADMAYLIQREFEVSIINKVKYLLQKSNLRKIIISGGVALNCLANGLIYQLKNVDDVYVPCAPGDEGQSMGNALYGYFTITKNNVPERIVSAYFGKEYSDSWKDYAKEKELEIRKVRNIEKKSALLLSKGNILGWYQSKTEFGPRALGHRSIIADPRFDFMKATINSKIKFREQFRPFAPSFLKEYQKDYFEDYDINSCFMSFALPIISKKQRYIPAVTHVDGTARLQTVTKDIDQRYYNLIEEFRKLTGVPCILNTSFNLNDEPIVETPIDAINTFLRCDMDYLVIGDYLIMKNQNRNKPE